MNNEILVGMGGLILSVLTYFAGVRRTEIRHRKDGKSERINRVLKSYLESELRRKNSGLDGLREAGVAILETDAEIREVGNLIVMHGKQNPLVIESGELDRVDLKKFFDYVTKERVNLFNFEISEVIKRPGA